jgi:hypothetical protein
MIPDGVAYRLSGRLTPEGAAIVRAAIDPLSAPTSQDHRSPEQRRADALVDVCRLALATDRLPANGGTRSQVRVGMDFDTVTQQLTGGRFDTGDPITPGQARKLACDAGIAPVMFTGRSVPLDIGRERRSITGPMRTALTEQDRGCAFPGCDRDARWTDAHHMIHWSVGGPSSVDNAVLVCSFHHDELPEPDNWTVFLDVDGLPTFIPPAHIDPEQKPRRNKYHRRQ